MYCTYICDSCSTTAHTSTYNGQKMNVLFLITMFILMLKVDACTDKKGKKSTSLNAGGPVPSKKKECGKSANLKKFVTKRLVGAKYGGPSWPVYIKRNGGKNKRDHCIGGLIEEGDILVTTADCVPHDEDKKGQVEEIEPNVVLDVFDSSSAASERTKRTGVAFIVLHGPPYPVALLLLNKPFDVQAGSKTQTICRPTTSIDFENCVVSGLSKDWTGQRAEEMGHLWMERIYGDSCKQTWPRVSFDSRTVVCAEAALRGDLGEGLGLGITVDHTRGVCQRDLGASLACYNKDDDTWVLAGVATVADENCPDVMDGISTIKPAVFTLFSYYDPSLIDQAIEELQKKRPLKMKAGT